jgi:hypothetical protein
MMVRRRLNCVQLPFWNVLELPRITGKASCDYHNRVKTINILCKLAEATNEASRVVWYVIEQDRYDTVEVSACRTCADVQDPRAISKY